MPQWLCCGMKIQPSRACNMIHHWAKHKYSLAKHIDSVAKHRDIDSVARHIDSTGMAKHNEPHLER
jgi:hypothetical protein